MASLVLYGSKQDWHVWKVLVTAKYANAKITLEEDFIICSPGKGTIKNLNHSSSVSFLFPPNSHGGFSMIIDGICQAQDQEKDFIKVAVTDGVLHRPA